MSNILKELKNERVVSLLTDKIAMVINSKLANENVYSVVDEKGRDIPTEILLKLYKYEELGLVKSDVIYNKDSAHTIFKATQEFKDIEKEF